MGLVARRRYTLPEYHHIRMVMNSNVCFVEGLGLDDSRGIACSIAPLGRLDPDAQIFRNYVPSAGGIQLFIRTYHIQNLSPLEIFVTYCTWYLGRLEQRSTRKVVTPS